MSKNVNNLKFIATGALNPVLLQDWSKQLYYSVKNFGAVGDGVEDDWVAIQACIDACFGTYEDPNAAYGPPNIAMYFPPGRYNVSKMLIFRAVRGGRILGAGSECTTIKYTGLVPAEEGIPPFYSYSTEIFATPTALFVANGFNTCSIRGLTLEMPTPVPPPASAIADIGLEHTVCINLDWARGLDIASPPPNGSVALSGFQFDDVRFKNATYAMLIGEGGNSQGDSSLETACTVVGCANGITPGNLNALAHSMVGGSVVGCTNVGVNGGVLPIPGLYGTYLENTNLDIKVQNDSVEYLGNTSRTVNFAELTNCAAVLIGIDHDNPTNGYFVNGGSATIVMTGCHSKKGNLTGLVGWYINGGTVLERAPCPVSGGGVDIYRGLREWTNTQPLVFADLPSSGSLALGLRMNITDSPTTTWGANVTVGGGSNKVLIRWNGSNWTVVGK